MTPEGRNSLGPESQRYSPYKIETRMIVGRTSSIAMMGDEVKS